MSRSWRPLVWAAWLLAAWPGTGMAQTLYVRSARPAVAVDVLYENSSVGSGTTDASGSVQLALTLASGTTERVVQFYLDRCQNGLRVGTADRDRLVPAAAPECERVDIPGLFIMRRTTSIVLDVGPTQPILLIRQGPPPPQWLQGDYTGDTPALVQSRGLNLYGGFTLPRFVHAFELACGDVNPCKATDFRPTLTFGGTYWILSALGAELSIVKNGTLTAEGSDDSLRFDHELVADVVTVAANAGGMFGTVRVYARGGLNYHRATSTMNQTLDDRTVTDVDGVSYTIKGGTQRNVVNTSGWGWMFGGGVEVWIKPRLGVYGEVAFGKLKGDDLSGGEADLDERFTFGSVGVRYHVGDFLRRSPRRTPPPTAPATPTATP
jgi:hypothetical protein